jgi:hypothetical protein
MGDQANKAQLGETVGTQVDAARTGTDLLDAAQRSLSKMRESYKVLSLTSFVARPHFVLLPLIPLPVRFFPLFTPSSPGIAAAALCCFCGLETDFQ